MDRSNSVMYCRCGFNQEQMDYQPTPEEQALFPNLTGTEFYRCLDQNQCMPELEACDSEEICLSTAVRLLFCPLLQKKRV